MVEKRSWTLKRGLLRLWMVFSVAWLVFCGFLFLPSAWDSYYTIHSDNALIPLSSLARPWKEVVFSPEYRALSQSDQGQLQNEYFCEVVAPGVPETDRKSARDKFYAWGAVPWPISTNPRTGEKIVLDYGVWITYTRSVTDPKTGEKAYVVGGFRFMPSLGHSVPDKPCQPSKSGQKSMLSPHTGVLLRDPTLYSPDRVRDDVPSGSQYRVAEFFKPKDQELLTDIFDNRHFLIVPRSRLDSTQKNEQESALDSEREHMKDSSVEFITAGLSVPLLLLGLGWLGGWVYRGFRK